MTEALVNSREFKFAHRLCMMCDGAICLYSTLLALVWDIYRDFSERRMAIFKSVCFYNSLDIFRQIWSYKSRILRSSIEICSTLRYRMSHLPISPGYYGNVWMIGQLLFDTAVIYFVSELLSAKKNWTTRNWSTAVTKRNYSRWYMTLQLRAPDNRCHLMTQMKNFPKDYRIYFERYLR